MMEFNTFEDVLDFAILQEKAAQQFYSDLEEKVTNDDVRLFYKTLIQEEHLHELKLRELKRFGYELVEPDMETLKESGYLDAMPVSPEISFVDAVRYAIKKERSARMLYHTLGEMCKRNELKELFEELADQEDSHAKYFKAEYGDLLAK
jgi:rubrerythrin